MHILDLEKTKVINHKGLNGFLLLNFMSYFMAGWLLRDWWVMNTDYPSGILGVILLTLGIITSIEVKKELE